MALTHCHRNHKWNIPFNSVYATSAIVAVLSFIPLGSSLAFEILVSLSLQGLLSTYMISIGQYLQTLVSIRITR
jgi:choline transport protein